MDIPTGDFRDLGSSYLKTLSSPWVIGGVITVAAWNLDHMPVAKAPFRKTEIIDIPMLSLQVFPHYPVLCDAALEQPGRVVVSPIEIARFY